MIRDKNSKINKTLKTILIVAGTIAGSLAIVFTIACLPFGGNENYEISESNVQVEIPDETGPANTTADGADYKSMSKDELLAVVEEKDAEIAELTNKVEELTILAEQTTNAIVQPTAPSYSGNSSDDSDDDDAASSGSSSSGSDSSSNSSSGSGSSGNNSSGNSSSGNSSSGNSSSGSNSSGSSSSGNSSSDRIPETSDTGL